MRKYNENIFILFFGENVGNGENVVIIYTLQHIKEHKMFISEQYLPVYNMNGEHWDNLCMLMCFGLPDLAYTFDATQDAMLFQIGL